MSKNIFYCTNLSELITKAVIIPTLANGGPPMAIIRNILIAMFFLAFVTVGFIIKTFYDAGEFKKLKLHFDGESKSISGVISSEDITIDPRTGFAFISSADHRAQRTDKNQVRQGAIFGLNLNSTNSKLVNLTANFSKEFNPHGIGLWMGENDNTSLFVVNHGRDGHFVEIFDYLDKKLVHRESVSGALMHGPNDVIPVGSRKFYVTNDHGNSSRLGRMVEEYLQLARSFVLYYDGENFSKVAKGLAYANGINMSADGQTVYVAATVGKKLYVYNRHKDSGHLDLRNSIELETGPDNIELDKSGALWIGSHPKMLTFVKYSKDPTKLSPSQVLKVVFQNNGEHTVEEIYLNNGESLSGSSVAAVFKDIMLIGSVFDNHFLLCKLR